MGDMERCEDYIREMFEHIPGQKIRDQEFDSEYVNIYNKVKAEYWFSIKSKSEEEEESEQKIIEKLAQKPKKKKNKLVRILVLAGIVVTVGVVAAVILGLGNKDQTIQEATSGVIRLVNLSSVAVWYSVLDIQDILYASQIRLVTVPEGNYSVRFFDDEHSETQTVIVLAGTETYVFFRGWDESIRVQHKQ
jgi:hypothetical protein